MKTVLSLAFVFLFLACGGDAAPLIPVPPDPPVGTIPVLISVAPAMNSRTMPVAMTISGMHLDAISPTATWSFPGYPGCTAATYVGMPISASAYKLTITPGASAAVGDLCNIRVQQPGVDVTLSPAFSTGL